MRWPAFPDCARSARHRVSGFRVSESLFEIFIASAPPAAGQRLSSCFVEVDPAAFCFGNDLKDNIGISEADRIADLPGRDRLDCLSNLGPEIRQRVRPVYPPREAEASRERSVATASKEAPAISLACTSSASCSDATTIWRNATSSVCGKANATAHSP